MRSSPAGVTPRKNVLRTALSPAAARNALVSTSTVAELPVKASSLGRPLGPRCRNSTARGEPARGGARLERTASYETRSSQRYFGVPAQCGSAKLRRYGTLERHPSAGSAVRPPQHELYATWAGAWA